MVRCTRNNRGTCNEGSSLPDHSGTTDSTPQNRCHRRSHYRSKKLAARVMEVAVVAVGGEMAALAVVGDGAVLEDGAVGSGSAKLEVKVVLDLNGATPSRSRARMCSS